MTAFEAGAGYGGQNRGGGADVILGGGSEPLYAHADRGLASKRIIVGYGFWIFLLSDIIMFSAFFATYAVLSRETAGRPEREGPLQPHQRRDRDGVSFALELHLRHRHHRR